MADPDTDEWWVRRGIAEIALVTVVLSVLAVLAVVHPSWVSVAGHTQLVAGLLVGGPILALLGTSTLLGALVRADTSLSFRRLGLAFAIGIVELAIVAAVAVATSEWLGS